MEIAEVVDRQSLKAYLDMLDGDNRVYTARRVAFRSAARVAPLAFFEFSDPQQPIKYKTHGRLTPLSIFGALAICGSRMVYPAPRISSAAAVAATYAAAAVAAHAHATDAAAYAAAAAQAHAHARDAAAAAAHAAVAHAHSTAAHATDAHIWAHIRKDLGWCATGLDTPTPPLWFDSEEPENLGDTWEVAKAQMVTKEPDDWSFWIAWFDRVRVGRDLHADKLAEILNPLREDDWYDPANTNPKFDDLLAIYEAEDAVLLFGETDPTPLAQSYVSDFSFDDVRKVMQLLGITDDNAHLREPAFIQGFLDDAEEAQDLLQDFADDAQAMAGGNYAGVMQRKAEKVLSEFRRASDKTHLRARYLVTMASKLERHSKDAKARADLGETLCEDLKDALGQLKHLCRKHFGPAYAALSPLGDVSSDALDQDAVIALFDQVVARLEAPGPGMTALDHDAMMLFRSMLEDLKYTKAALADANADEFRDIMEGVFAEETAEFGVTFNRLVKKSVEVGGATLGRAEAVIDVGERVQSVADVLDAVRMFLGLK